MRKKKRENNTKFKDGFFVAWDGEGVTGEKKTGGFQHIYTRLSAAWHAPGDGWQYRTLKAEPGQRLTTDEMLEFMMSVNAETSDYAIHVGYYLSYDFTHMLRDLSARQAAYAITSGGKRWGVIKDFEVKLSTRRELRVRRVRWVRGDDGKRKKEVTGQMSLWDVAGFFQSSFLSAVRMWLGEEYEDYDLLRHGKEARKDFVTWSDEKIEEYNYAELRALVRVMDALRTSIQRAGFVLSRWDGAGALASSFYKKYTTRKAWAAATLPRAVHEAARYAYFGGRIEYIRFGVHRGTVYHADINSAYPAGMASIPDLTRGRWYHEAEVSGIRDYALYRLRWRDAERGGIAPLPFRLPDKRVLFPTRGEGWYWGVEVRAALTFLQGRGDIDILEGWVYEAEGDKKMFGWIVELYNRRRALVQRAKQGDVAADGEQKVIKLGLNSLYGKTVQRIGYVAYNQEVTYRYAGQIERVIEYNDYEKRPPYYNLGIGGYITAYTRAKLLLAASSAPDAVICFATDGIFSRAKLDVDVSDSKELGKWDVKTYDDAFFLIVQPGVYYLRHNGTWSEACRGFLPATRASMNTEQKNQAIEARVSAILSALRDARYNRTAAVALEDARFMTIKQALAQDWSKRGEWLPAKRLLRVYDASAKRAISGRYRAAYQRLVETRPNDALLAVANTIMSAPYSGLPVLAPADIDDIVELDDIVLDAFENGYL